MDKIPLETIGEESAIRFRDCFSDGYIQSAAVLCRLGYGIKRPVQHPGLPRRICSCSTRPLSSTPSFPPSRSSSLRLMSHADAADDAYFFADDEHETLLRTIGEKWHNEKNFDRAPLISKYQKILAIAEKPLFEEGDQAYANVRTLIEIRNHLLHYKREWVVIRDRGTAVDGEETTAEKFEKILRKKFATNPLAQKNLPFFPDKCLGHGCAEWAIVNSIIFADEFFRRLGLPVPYEGIRDELATR